MRVFGTKRFEPYPNVFGTYTPPVELLGELPIKERGMQLVETVLAAEGLTRDETVSRSEVSLIANTQGVSSHAPDETVSRTESVVITNV